MTAARGSQPIADVLADVTVIGAAEIARAGAQSLTELVQRQPGVEITQNGGPGSLSGIFLRGANRGQTLVLIDGIRIASSSAGATSLEAIPLDQIDRIEILRGPASSLYGADAIGGVVQVFTRRGTAAFTGNASAGYGTYGTWDVKGGVSGTSGPLTFAVQGAAKASNGFNAVVDPASFLYNGDKDGYKNQSVSANAGFTFAPEQELTAQFFRSHLNSQFDGGPGFDDRTITVAETWQVASRNRLAPFWVSRLSAGAGIDDSKTESAFDDFPFKTTQRQYAWQNEFTLPLGMLTAGFERREEHLATDRRLRRDGPRHEFAVRHLPAARSTSTRCRRICATTIRTSTAARRRAPSPTAIASHPRCASRRAIPRASRRRRSTTSTTPASPIPTSCPKRRRTSKAGIYWNGNVDGRDAWSCAPSPIGTACRSSSFFNATPTSTARRTTSIAPRSKA